MQWKKLLPAFLSMVCFLKTPLANAYDEPVVNLGYTSFLDGGPPSGPGVYLQNYFQYYSTHSFNDKNGKRLPFPRTDLRVTADIVQFIYVSHTKIFGATFAINAVEPTVLKARVYEGLPVHVLKATTGFGDLTFGPALQFDPIVRKNGKGPLYVQRLELDSIAPIGHFDSNFTIVPSSNFWSVNPYWAATLWITPKWAISHRTHYLWNARSRNPNVSFGPQVFSIQAGQAVFANIATDYAITEKFHLGINGYIFNQFTNTRVNGQGVPGREEKIWSIGPGALLGLTKNQFVFFNLYIERGARNRTQGNNFIFRYVLHLG